MKIVHVRGWEVGGQRHEIKLETDDGFLRQGPSIRVNLDLFADAVHLHPISDITGLQSALDGKPAVTVTEELDSRVIDLEGLTASFPVSSLTGILDVDFGGTGTGTEFTPGSIVFAGAAGVYSQDNANLFWDDANNRLGILTNAPTTPFSIKNKFTVDPTASNAASGIYCLLNTDNVISTTGFKFFSVQSSGTERIRLDWSAGNAIRWYAPGRMDFESAGQMFFSGTQFFLQAHTSINRTGDAGATATQKDSYGLYLQHSGWTGAASTQRFALIRNKASTAVNLDHSLAFFVNVTGGIGTEGTEAMRIWWDNTNSIAKVGIGTTTPGTKLFVNGSFGITTSTPASASATGVAGTIAWDASYLYVCTATDTWKRVAIATW